MIPYLGWKNPLDDVFWQTPETSRYKISIFRAECPSIDPNIAHRKEDLEAEGYTVLGQEKKTPHLEIFENFCVPVDIYTGGYDLLLIQKDYGFEKIPRVKDVYTNSVIFTDGYTDYEISKKTLEYYTYRDTTMVYLVKLEQMLLVKDNGFLYDELKAEIYNNRQKSVKMGYGFYLLDNNQLKLIDSHNKQGGVKLADMQKEIGEPCFFVQFDLF